MATLGPFALSCTGTCVLGLGLHLPCSWICSLVSQFCPPLKPQLPELCLGWTQPSLSLPGNPLPGVWPALPASASPHRLHPRWPAQSCAGVGSACMFSFNEILQKKLSGHPNIVQFCSAASIGKEESDTGQAEFLLLTELCKGEPQASQGGRGLGAALALGAGSQVWSVDMQPCDVWAGSDLTRHRAWAGVFRRMWHGVGMWRGPWSSDACVTWTQI